MTEKRPELVVIAGPNGSGKTTITEQLLVHEWGADCIYINPDAIAREKFGDWNDPDAVMKAAQYATEERYRVLAERKNLVFETVFSSEEKVVFVKKAVDAGYFVRFFYVCTESPSINAARVATRFMEGGHSVPIEKIVSRYTKSLINCARILKIVDRIYFYDNSVENMQASLLFRVSKGKIVKIYESRLPRWAELLLP